jgi:hypothetical protein
MQRMTGDAIENGARLLIDIGRRLASRIAGTLDEPRARE